MAKSAPVNSLGENKLLISQIILTQAVLAHAFPFLRFDHASFS